MPILFCNISWMEYYGGRNQNDQPKGGGAFPRTQGYCGEECNFVRCDDGYAYGHFETRGRQVRLEHFGIRKDAEFIDGVDIVWTAPIDGKDPRAVIGWYKDARLYRRRQDFNNVFPSDQHYKDKIPSFMVKALWVDVFLLEPADRQTLTLQRGPGWSGQSSWWYAEDSANSDAREFVRRVKAAMDGHSLQNNESSNRGGRSSRKGRAGAAASDAYMRYLKKYEGKVHPRHHILQRKFTEFLTSQNSDTTFPTTYRDDLRYQSGDDPPVMVEVKPTDTMNLRFAIRTAIGQLLDYRQSVQWKGHQLIVVGDEVLNADDLELAFANGFGLAWPDENVGFQFRWPPGIKGTA